MARSSSGRRSEIFPYTRSYNSLSYSVVFKIPPGEIAGRLTAMTQIQLQLTEGAA